MGSVAVYENERVVLNNANGKTQIPFGLGKDCQRKERKRWLGVRNMREAMQKTGRTVRHAQKNVDGCTP